MPCGAYNKPLSLKQISNIHLRKRYHWCLSSEITLAVMAHLDIALLMRYDNVGERYSKIAPPAAVRDQFGPGHTENALKKYMEIHSKLCFLSEQDYHQTPRTTTPPRGLSTSISPVKRINIHCRVRIMYATRRMLYAPDGELG